MNILIYVIHLIIMRLHAHYIPNLYIIIPRKRKYELFEFLKIGTWTVFVYKHIHAVGSLAIYQIPSPHCSFITTFNFTLKEKHT